MADLLGVGRSLRMRTLVTEDTRLTLYAGSDEGEPSTSATRTSSTTCGRASTRGRAAPSPSSASRT
jgi:hypothetical protein